MIAYRGLGATLTECEAVRRTGHTTPGCLWGSLFGYDPTPIGTPPPPPQELWTIAPESQESAQATVDTLLNEQMERQKAINASYIVPVFDPLDASTYPFDITAYYPLLIGIGLFGLVAIVGGGSPRRYGR